MKKTKTKQSEAAPVVTQQVVTGNTDLKTITYVVVRDGLRVSDKEYSNPEDANALYEKEFWTKIAQTHSYGEPVEIVQYDPKKHRVWNVEYGKP